MAGRVASHYDTLGVARDASPATIRVAWRMLARQWHPDFHRGDRSAEQRMQAINVAFEVLSCPLKRREYDRWLEAGGAGPAAPRPAAGPRPRPMTEAERREAWVRARAAREAKARWEAARPRVRRSTVNPDSLGPALTAVVVAIVALALFWHALPGPRPQPRLLAEALGLKEPRRTALAAYAPVAPPSTEPRARVVVSPPPSRAAAGPAAPAPLVDQAAADAPADGEGRRATLAELVEAARRGEAAAQAWTPRVQPAAVLAAADAGLLAQGSLGALGQAVEAAAAARAAALAEQEMRRLMVSDAQLRAEAAQRMAALDAELERAAVARRAAQAAAARPASAPAAEAAPATEPAGAAAAGPAVLADAAPGAQP